MTRPKPGVALTVGKPAMSRRGGKEGDAGVAATPGLGWVNLQRHWGVGDGVPLLVELIDTIS